MDHNHAESFYYFPDEYYRHFLEHFKNNILFVEALFEGKVICSEFYLLWDNKYIHSHLSGTLSEYKYLAPDYVVMYGITLWGKEHGYEVIHTGGGTSNAEDDSLYMFKKKFGKNTDFDFYIAKKIWNRDIYKELCQKVGADENADFFPAYRKSRD